MVLNAKYMQSTSLMWLCLLHMVLTTGSWEKQLYFNYLQNKEYSNAESCTSLYRF